MPLRLWRMLIWSLYLPRLYSRYVVVHLVKVAEEPGDAHRAGT